MVDLVKIRRKAKEKKEAEDAAAAQATPGPSKPDEIAADVDSPPEDVEKRRDAVPEGKDEKRSVPREKPPTAASSAGRDATGRKASAAPAKADKQKAASPEESLDAVEAKAPRVESPMPATGHEPAGESIDRLERFKREAGKRRNWAADAARAAAVAVEEEASRDLELLRFRLAGEEYAVDIEKIVEIVSPRATTRVPNADTSIVGIMSLRGTIVTVFDLRRRLGHPRAVDGQSDDRRLIVVEREGETAGFLVDRVSRVVKLDPSELESHPVVSATEQSDYVQGVFQASDGLVILLDLERILASQL
jgi:purine-binding chemotaxis protein CheW